MGDPRRLRKKYKTPPHPWQKQRIDYENRLVNDYGLKNKREVWRASALISKYRSLVRQLLAKSADDRMREEENVLGKLKKLGVLPEKARVDDVLALTPEAVLERRLQTVVWKKGLAATPLQARQFITHGKIALDSRKTKTPGMLVSVQQEGRIAWHGQPVVLQLPRQG